ncbi:metalloregulator ArsR/SmtB family transcription factor [Patulibacter brassicae]|uniref:Metalloregulator ArsR/SmtB family transcription factor n=1 Tax=Patulibacter brassicae TaxID=1705717 RepID=A0ABU4VFL1_9ACTN|nr:metalloregulator ArsR/SmtB family transcription factor [Patulibacter brassicae]MDX8150579.1 metalloregulator ArsR/SmtB family transcription factor [Patulibacter brassicae]
MTTSDVAPTDVPLLEVLQALADPVRLAIVRDLADGSERPCGAFAPQLSKATRSHHLRVLREAGLTATRQEGTRRLVSLRREACEEAYPGLLAAVLDGSAVPA